MMDMYKGKPLDEMTREELIAALQEFAVFHQDIVAHQQQRIQFLMDTPNTRPHFWKRFIRRVRP